MKAKIYGLLFLAFLCQKVAALEQVKVIVGNDNYQIPSIYLFPNNDIKPKIERSNSIAVGLFLPDFSGYTKGRNQSTVGKYDPNQLSILWTGKGKGTHFNAQKRFNNSLKYGLIEPKGTKLENLVAHNNLYNDGVTYISSSREGDEVIINCNGDVNYICRLRYLNSKREIGVFILFDQRHLSNWSSINDEVIKMIDSWKT
ncbi:hypothetical protein [Thalassotalea mangrovi]|uniref:Secreted protein n=1 Tax=Thalassotalea mangrovi TaxID=2572245 RepID=A0A4U1B5W4_9GAMM|nr:hypothetical protein [Thalassotalea mangrovi]TKB45291.1 hypothetical protein E8M12_08795 [Thalassotalea mangrovi]